MTKEQKQYKALIKADIHLVGEHWDSEDKALRLQAAYHMQQAIEKTIKLKAEIAGLNLWGHDIDVLIKKCDDAGIDIGILLAPLPPYKINTFRSSERVSNPLSSIRNLGNVVFPRFYLYLGFLSRKQTLVCLCGH